MGAPTKSERVPKERVFEIVHQSGQNSRLAHCGKKLVTTMKPKSEKSFQIKPLRGITRRESLNGFAGCIVMTHCPETRPTDERYNISAKAR
jgi:hypothetical protein